MSTSSKFTRSSSALVFSDVEALISSKAASKAEGNLPPIGLKRSAGRLNIPDSKKKKLIADEDVFDGLSPAEIKKKIVLLTQSAIDVLVKNNEDLKKELVEMRRKCDAEKEEIMEIKKNEMLKMEENYLKEIDDIASEAKTFVAKSVLKARLMMVDNVKSGKCSSWDEDLW